MNLVPKTTAAIGGGGVATALVTILDWILSFWHISLPAAVGAAFAAVLAAVGSYFAPRSAPTPEQIAEIKSQP